jgi:hypothetical protein
MLRHAKGLVSALLPAVPLILCPACGGGSADDAASVSAPLPVTANPSPGAGNSVPAVANTADGYARVGQTFQLQPAASDADGDSLNFTAENLPPWASIDPATGQVTGTPGELDVGVYESIRIIVADGRGTAQSSPFSITVLADPGTGYAALRWEVPPAKVDGSPLDDLAGYRILYGRHADDLDQSVLIDNPAVTSFEFTTLESGIWYFAVVAVNAGGLEGPPTITATKSI